MKLSLRHVSKVAAMSFAILATALTTSGYAVAALVTYQFSGNISEVPFSVFTSGLAGGVGANGFNAGLKLSGTYTVDTATTGLLPTGLPTQLYNGSVTNLNFTVGNYAGTFQSGGTNFTTINNGAPDLYSVNLGVNGGLVKGQTPSLFSINLVDETGTAFSSVSLPGSTPPALSSFNVNRWSLVFANGAALVGSLDSLKAVPLPASVILFGAGLIGLVGLGARGRFANSTARG
jgi:hypothetical protein